MTGWSGKTVLVTGHGGFLGSWLSRALCRRSARVLGLSHRGHAPRAGDGEVEVIAADICDKAAIAPVFARHRIDVLFHLAAQTLPTMARQDPCLAFEVNAMGAWNVLEAARNAARVPQIVISSTDSVYGENDGSPFTEDCVLAPMFPYEASKACAEMVARCYHKTYRLPVAIARFCNLYGPEDVAASRLMAGAIDAALRGERQRLRGNGSAVRNYLYVEDAVAALLALAEALERPDIAGEAFNFCEETPLSVLDVVGRVLALAGRPDLAPHLGSGTPGEISIKRASAGKARRVLGWRPTVGLDEGLARTIAWHRARGVAHPEAVA